MKTTQKKDTELYRFDHESVEWHDLELLAKRTGHASLKSAANDGHLWGKGVNELREYWLNELRELKAEGKA